jgi:hypothetical protein
MRTLLLIDITSYYASLVMIVLCFAFQKIIGEKFRNESGGGPTIGRSLIFLLEEEGRVSEERGAA